MGNTLVKKVFDGIPFLKIPLDTKRKRLLNNPVAVDLMRECYIAGMDRISGVTSLSFEEFIDLLKTSMK